MCPVTPTSARFRVRIVLRAGLVLLLVLSLVGCAGREEGRELPRGARDLHVPPFENESNEIALENLLTEAAVQQFLADGRVNLVDDPREADVVLRGTITGYRRSPVIFDARDIVQQYRVQMAARLRLVEPGTGEVLREVRGITRRTFYSDEVAPIETEEDAQRRVIDQLGRDVVRRTLRGWPYVSGTVGPGESGTAPANRGAGKGD